MLIDQLSQRGAFTETERQIAEVILKYPQYVIDMPLKELASRAYVSEASVIRLAQKLGCKGYGDLKLRLARELDSFTGERPAIPVDVPIPPNEGPAEVCASMYDLSRQALREAREAIDVGAVTKAARLLQSSDLVRIYGRGESLIIAEDFCYKLLRIGVRAALNAQNGFQEAGSLDGETRRRIRECAVVVSEYCDSTHVNYVIDELRAARIPYVLVTASSNPWPYDHYAHVTLRYPSGETRYKMGSFASRTAALYVLDCLYAMLFSFDYDRNVSNLKDFALRKEQRAYFYRRGV